MENNLRQRSAIAENVEALRHLAPKAKAARVHRTSFGAPERCSVEVGNGKFYTRQWHTRNDKGELWDEKWHYEYTVLGLHNAPQPARAQPKPTPEAVAEAVEVNRVDALLEALSEADRAALHALLTQGDAR